MEVLVTTHPGLEQALSQELKDFGATGIGEERRLLKAQFDSPAKLYAFLKRSRLALRVYQPIKTFSAIHRAMLYDQVKRLKWEQWIVPGATIRVDSTLHGDVDAQSGFRHSIYVSQLIKDALVDRIRETRGQRPNVDKQDPDVRIVAFMSGKKCYLSFDLAGESLHRRGFRELAGDAPFKETLAAGLLRLMDWNPRIPLIDGMCGAGTLLIEAANTALQKAPREGRLKYGIQSLQNFDTGLWRSVPAHSVEAAEEPVLLYGMDRSRAQIDKANANAKSGGVGKSIDFHQADFFDFSPQKQLEKLQPNAASADAKPVHKWILFLNPPYGHRLKSDDMSDFYKRMGDHLKKNCSGGTAFILCPQGDLIKKIGLRASAKIPVWNGPIECRLLKFELY